MKKIATSLVTDTPNNEYDDNQMWCKKIVPQGAHHQNQQKATVLLETDASIDENRKTDNVSFTSDANNNENND